VSGAVQMLKSMALHAKHRTISADVYPEIDVPLTGGPLRYQAQKIRL
jgi:hypothetical protein